MKPPFLWILMVPSINPPSNFVYWEKKILTLLWILGTATKKGGSILFREVTTRLLCPAMCHSFVPLCRKWCLSFEKPTHALHLFLSFSILFPIFFKKNPPLIYPEINFFLRATNPSFAQGSSLWSMPHRPLRVEWAALPLSLAGGKHEAENLTQPRELPVEWRMRRQPRELIKPMPDMYHTEDWYLKYKRKKPSRNQ